MIKFNHEEDNSFKVLKFVTLETKETGKVFDPNYRNFSLNADKNSIVVSIQDVKSFVVDIESLDLIEDYELSKNKFTVVAAKDFYIEMDNLHEWYNQRLRSKEGD